MIEEYELKMDLLIKNGYYDIIQLKYFLVIVVWVHL